MTDEQIESRVCRMFDDLDARFMQSNSMSFDEYDRQSKAINEWADRQYQMRYPRW